MARTGQRCAQSAEEAAVDGLRSRDCATLPAADETGVQASPAVFVALKREPHDLVHEVLLRPVHGG
ncbi:MAG: hypothetical protein ABT15_22225 [Pseudonocardia sp. SCN 73-27]|nr:MAG: hypothetical protein ABS80_15405 [Pseudonocardia sp. SCN 72-51]ODV03747.1 MAG: hypothetical protein ABT15_22225 [Pseudonocardia sp. SCN 73-27]